MMSAPAKMMSARLGSRPNRRARSSIVGAACNCVTTERISSLVNSNRFNVFGSGTPRLRKMIRAIVSAVPDDVATISKPSSSTSGATTENDERMNDLQLGIALGCSVVLEKNRSVSRTAPNLKLRANITSSSIPTTTSVEPPPMSHTNIGRSWIPIALSTPRWISRASSTPETTSMSIPVSLRTFLMNSERFLASRTALVATARSLASCDFAIFAMRVRLFTPRSMASSESSFISPPPWPRRTTSFSRVTTSKPPGTGLATTRWKLLVPISNAATKSLIRSDDSV